MTENQQFSLSWGNHNDCFLSLVKNFFDEHFLTDIELICRDNRKIGCHRIVLATFSEFFHKVFSEQLSTERSFAMVNTQYEDMMVLVEFMYTGEVKVSKDDLPRILELADFLQISGFKENLPKEIVINGCIQNGKHEQSPKHEQR